MLAAGIDSRRAWSVCAAAGVAICLAFGTNYSFGAFFEAMADDFDAGRGATAVVFGVTSFLFFGTGVISGPLADRIGPRPLTAAGAVLMGAGLMLTSRASELWIGYLTYGIGVGFGAGLFVTPMFSTVAGWFVRRRALALALTAAGSGIGTLIIVPTASVLIDAHGWRTTYMALAILDLVAIGAASFVLAPAPQSQRPPAAVDHMRLVAATNAFRRFWVSGVMFTVAQSIAFAFVVDFATDEGVSSRAAAFVLALIGASSIFGRLGVTPLVVRLGSVRVVQVSLLAVPAAFTLWLLAGGTYVLLVTFAVVLGVAYGAYVSISSEVCAFLFGVVGLGGVIGMLYLGAGIGGLLGSPMGGVLADVSSGRALPIAAGIAASAVAAISALGLPHEPVDLGQPQVAARGR
jgi:predicted MFS family arabinose efflux permease